MRKREANSGSFTRESLIRHGMCYTPTWQAWRDMKARCSNPELKNYPRYGGRGISVCKRWLVFEHFLADMGVRPDGMSLDRKDNNGNYDPGNCEWVNRFAQMKNTRRNRFVEYHGERLIISEWARRFVVSRFAIRDGLRRGESAESIFGRISAC